MKISRILKRLSFYGFKEAIKVMSYLDHRLYMKMYIPLLKKNGMTIIGTPRFIGAKVKFDDFDRITLNHRVVISEECYFLTHDYSITTALIAIDKEPKSDIALVRDIVVGYNVFIGARTVVMPGTTIGNNVIIGTGAVVRGNIPDDSIVIGNPGVIIRNIKDQAVKWEKYLDSNFVRQD